MSAAMVVPGQSSLSTFDEERGMSDDVELQRAGLSTAEGLGEVLLDYGNDFQELGLTRADS